MTYVGIDIGGTNIKLGLISERGSLYYSKSVEIPNPSAPKIVALKIKEELKKISAFIKKHVLNPIKAVGVSITGVFNKNANKISKSTNLGWTNVDFSKILKKEIGLKVFMFSDGESATLAEFLAGSLKGVKNGLLITLGTSIGAGSIINKRLHRGTNRGSTSIGHMFVGKNDYDCVCGKNGCLRSFTCSEAITNHAKDLLEKNPNQGIFLRNFNPSNLTPKIIFDAAKKGDEIAVRVVEKFTHHLALGIGNLINIMDPEIVTISGGISQAGSYLTKLLNEKLPNFLYNKTKKAKIKISKMGSDAGMLGAAFLAKTAQKSDEKKK